MNMKKLYTISIIILIASFTYAQENTNDSLTVHDFEILSSTEFDGDTLAHSMIKEVVILPEYRKDLNWFQKRKHARLIKNLKKVYPYSQLAKQMLDTLVAELDNFETDKEKREFVKELEQELKAEYEDDLRRLTITQGKLLIKLVDRETGSSSYDLVKEFRGSVSAVFWQTLARIFGSDLKSKYDAEGEDALIEFYIDLIERDLI